MRLAIKIALVALATRLAALAVPGTVSSSDACGVAAVEPQTVFQTPQDNGAAARIYAQHRRMVAKYAARAARRAARAGNARSNVVTRQSFTAPVKNYDKDYAVTLTVGSAKQPVEVLIDTGSDVLWFPIQSFPKLGGGAFFDSDASSTFASSSKPFTYSYEDTTKAEGVWAKDTVSLGPLEVKAVDFGAVDVGNVTGGYTGIIGLGINDDSPTIIQSLIKANTLSAPLFGVYMSKTASQITIGSIDTSLYTGDLSTYPVAFSSDWKLATVAKVNGVAVPAGSFTVEVDTGNNEITLPRKVAKDVFAAVSGAKLHPPGPDSDPDVDVYQYPCDTKHEIGFSFAGADRVFNIALNDLKSDVVTGKPGYCLSAISGSDSKFEDNEILGVLGDSFLRSYYSVYTFNGPDETASIGFASNA